MIKNTMNTLLMKKNILTKIQKTLFVVFSIMLAMPALALEAEGNRGSGTFKNPFGSNITNITQILNPLIDLIINIGGILVVLFIIIAGFKMVLAQGDPGKLNDAKKMLFWTIIGGVILLGSKVLAEVVRGTVEQLNI